MIHNNNNKIRNRKTEKKSMASIREEILKLTNPEPILKDPENDFGLDSSTNLIDKDDIGGLDVNQEFSKLRRQAAGLLSDSDRKYAGKKLSRKDWMTDSGSRDSVSEDDISDSEPEKEEDDDESGDDVSDDDDDDDGGGADNSEDDDKDLNGSGEDMESENDVDDDIEGFKSKINSTTAGAKFTFSDDGDYGKYGDDFDEDEAEEGSDSDTEDDDEDDDDDDDDDSADYRVNDDDEVTSEDEEEGIQKFSTAAEDEIGKGNAAAQQLGLWDTLLEGRIKLQKAVSLINQLPQHSDWTQFSQGTDNFKTEAKKTQKVLKHLLDSLAHLQNVLLAQNSETVDLIDGAKKAGSTPSKSPMPDDDDEEIPSDSDEEMMVKEEANTPVKVKKRKIKMEEYPGLLKKRYERFNDYRDTTIQKWYDKTRLAAGKVKGKSFSAFDQSAVVQIKQILADKDRLIRRTQIKRSVYRVLGKKPKKEDPEIIPSENGEPEMIETANSVDQDKYDEEIFDDDDFYHQLLRELIQKKTADINDPIASTRQWLQIQKLRSKKKRHVDPKANKDRKIKYTVHKKLVNFMTPIDDSEWSHEARDDLFKSLFGKRHQLTDPAR